MLEHNGSVLTYIDSNLTHRSVMSPCGSFGKDIMAPKHYGRTSGTRTIIFLRVNHSHSRLDILLDISRHFWHAGRMTWHQQLRYLFRSGTNFGQVIIFLFWHLLWLAELYVPIFHSFMAFSGYAPSFRHFLMMNWPSFMLLFLSSFLRTITPRQFMISLHFAIHQSITFLCNVPFPRL